MDPQFLFRLALSLVWLPQALHQLLVWVFWLQVKEYRRDRFLLFLKSREGLIDVGLPLIAAKLLALLAATGLDSLPLTIISVILLLFLDLRFLITVIVKKLRRPVLTLRSGLVLTVGLAAIGLTLLVGLFAANVSLPGILLLGESFLFAAPMLGAILTLPLALAVKRREIARARQKLKVVNPVVVGVTGSYGKTTTKEFIAHLLAQKYRVAKTAGSENTELGVARKAIHDLDNGHRFFVVEMGAYAGGEIAALVNIVRPQIGVVTGIEPQHLALFGSLERIMQTKYELIAGLPPGGIAIFNLTNKYCWQMADRAKKERPDLKVFGYAVSTPADESAPTQSEADLRRLKAQSAKADFALCCRDFQSPRDFEKALPEEIPADCRARIRAAGEKGVEFEVNLGGETVRLTAPVTGLHFIENLAGAILLARLHDLSWAEISNGCSTIQLPGQTMQVSELGNGVVLIDDSHNSTPQAFLSALRYLEFFPHKQKVVITPGIIELGPETDAVHIALGQRLAQLGIDRLIVTSRELRRPLKAGLAQHAEAMLRYSNNRRDLESLLSEFTPGQNLVVLLEGRVPAYVLKVLRNFNHA